MKINKINSDIVVELIIQLLDSGLSITEIDKICSAALSKDITIRAFSKNTSTIIEFYPENLIFDHLDQSMKKKIYKNLLKYKELKAFV